MTYEWTKKRNVLSKWEVNKYIGQTDQSQIFLRYPLAMEQD